MNACVPLSLIVTGANRHDVTQLEAVLDAVQVQRPAPPQRRHEHLWADNGYRGAPAFLTIEVHAYVPYGQGREQDARELQRRPGKRAHRWVVEVAHSRFNRFRKPLVRYKKRADSFLRLNYLAATIIAFRKVPMRSNIVYG